MVWCHVRVQNILLLLRGAGPTPRGDKATSALASDGATSGKASIAHLREMVTGEGLSYRRTRRLGDGPLQALRRGAVSAAVAVRGWLTWHGTNDACHFLFGVGSGKTYETDQRPAVSA